MVLGHPSRSALSTPPIASSRISAQPTTCHRLRGERGGRGTTTSRTTTRAANERSPLSLSLSPPPPVSLSPSPLAQKLERERAEARGSPGTIKWTLMGVYWTTLMGVYWYSISKPECLLTPQSLPPSGGVLTINK